jgi:hypothetical protein
MTYCTGKLPPKIKYQTLLFKNFAADLPAPPPSCDKLALASSKLPGNPPVEILCPMDGNDKVGDCVIAGLAHATAINQGLVKKWDVATEAAVLKLYWYMTDGQDCGCNMLDVLTYWRKNRFAGDNILGFTKLDPKNHVHVKQAIQIFGGVILGFQVQENAQADFARGKTWTPGRLLNEGHCVYAYAYDDRTVRVATWAAGQPGSWDWVDETWDEAYVLLSPETLVPGFCPGFDFAAFQRALKAVTA